MPSPYHAGEVAVQARVGVREQADDLIGMFRDAIPPTLADFLAQHPFAVLSAADTSGNVWAVPISGEGGILAVPDPSVVAIQLNRLDPPFAPELVGDGSAGLLVIDFDRRLRIRINGTIARDGDALNLGVAQLYGNCTKYIQRRIPNPTERVPHPRSASDVGIFSTLSDAQRAWISRADTFFIATSHPESGADASHRGGRPGFVQAVDERTVTWPDYRGNNLFNTLGNLEIHSRCGLLFVDFNSGAALQLTGKAGLQEAAPTRSVPTGRTIRFELSSLRQIPPSPSLQYRLIEPFPYHPPVE